MTRAVRIYLALLATLVAGWFLLRADALSEAVARTELAVLTAVTALYMASHLFRMLRLALLSLEERDQAFELAAAHALTAFPSSFLPFKAGELLRLAALAFVYRRKRKALALWAAERFGDIAVLSTVILGMYLFDVNVPDTMRTVFVLFLVVGLAALFVLFAVAKTFVYLNRHLVLVSHSRHGLQLLRISHAVRQMEMDIYRCLDGRITAFLLLSALIWLLEIGALALFIRIIDGMNNGVASGDEAFGAIFASGLLASLPGKDLSEFGLYQSLALVLLTVIFAGAVILASRLKSMKG